MNITSLLWITLNIFLPPFGRKTDDMEESGYCEKQDKTYAIHNSAQLHCVVVVVVMVIEHIVDCHYGEWNVDLLVE